MDIKISRGGCVICKGGQVERDLRRNTASVARV